VLFAPVGDGQTRRRGSDAFRLASAVVGVVLCWVVIHADSNTEHQVATTLASAPNGLRWLISTVWWTTSVGVIAGIGVVVLVYRRWEAARDIWLSGGGAWLLCVLSNVLFGSTGGRPAGTFPAHVDLAFPVVRVAATVGVATAALPYLSRMVQRAIQVGIVLLALAAAASGSGLPVAVLAGLAVGWGTTALVHLVLGSPRGLPSTDEVSVLLEGIDVHAEGITPVARQVWGAGRFTGRVGGAAVDVSVYGRDAADAQLLAKAGRFLFYRASGPTLALTRRQQVEHEAYLTLMAALAGARVPEVLAAGPAGPARDALLVTRPPSGDRLSSFAAWVPPTAGTDSRGSDPPAPGSASAETAPAPSPGDDPGPSPDPVALDGRPLGDDAVDDVFRQVLFLRRAGIAHGALSTETIVVDGEGRAGLVDFSSALTVAPPDDHHRDVAAMVAATAVVVGPDRAIASAWRVLPSDVLVGALPFLQRAALDPVASRTLRGRKSLLTAARQRGAETAGVETPKLMEPRRVSWVTLLLVVGTLVGGWALIGVLVNVGKSWSTITGAKWGWVAATFVLAQAAYPAIAATTVGSVTSTLPYGRTVALEVADTFVGLAGGSMATLATRIRFFQQEGLAPTLAVSSGVLVSTASWIVKGGLFLIALPLAIGQMHFHVASDTSSQGHGHLVWVIVIAVLVVGVAVGVLLAVPRWRRLAAEKVRPKASEVWDHLKVLATRPRNLIEIFGGSAAAQILVALALGAALHAFGDHLGLATLLVVLTTASMLGGISPVPGGMGVVEAGMILGLTAAGINQTDAVAATFVQRLFTAYLPPIWGWFVLVWLRRREYL
jgi:glycosyltransferase 2 family protein